MSSGSHAAGRRPGRQTAVCPACGEGNPELAARCAACGTPLPASSSGTLTAQLAVPVPEAADPLVGSRVSHFRIVARLGEGGMGVVYKAVDEELAREVALKFLPPGRAGNPRDEARLRREALAAAALDHPNLGTVHEIGRYQGRRFLVLAFYDGETLAARLARGGPLGAAQAAAVCGQLASALAAAHAAGLVHRDLKPDNVMLLPDGRVKLLDFGLACDAGDGHSGLPQLTEEGSAVGTAAYMAPEQLRGEAAGPAADLWALGVLLYETLSGRRPFGGDRRGLVHAILHEDPPPLLEGGPETSPALAALAEITLRCLAKEPADRPGAAAVVAELRDAGLWEANAAFLARAGVSDNAAGPARATSGTGSDNGAGTGAPGVTNSGNATALAWSSRVLRSPRTWTLAAAAALALTAGLALLRERLDPPAPPLQVAVPRPEVGGIADVGERLLLEENLRAAVIRALTALDGVGVVDPKRMQGLAGSPAGVTRATGAAEAVAAEASCSGDLCRVTLRRLRAADDTVVREERIEILRSAVGLSAGTVAAAVRRAYAERELRTADLELQVSEADYDRYRALYHQVVEQEVPDEQILAGLADLRRRAPGFLDAHTLAVRVARRLYERTKDERVLEQGLAAARQARELAPDDPRPVASLFDLALDTGRLDTAREALAELERLEPIASEVLLRRARLADRAGDPEAAAELLQDLVAERPALDFLLTLANMEYRLGRLDQARAHAGEVLARFPDQPQAARTLAQIELLAGDPRRAVLLLESLARRDPGRLTLGNLGTALLLSGRYARAEAVLRRAYGLFPDDPQIALNLADSLQLLGRHAEAHGHYRAVAAAPAGGETLTDWTRLGARAQALAHLGDRRALEGLQQALRLTPDNPQLRLDAALVYTLLGETTAARVHARAALAGGVEPVWFRLPWLAPLRDDPEIARRLAGATREESGPSRPGSSGRS